MTPITNLVGVHGMLGSGKGAVAQVLVGAFGFEEWQFSKPVKDALLTLNPWVRVDETRYLRLADVVASCGWEDAKELTDVRVGLQRLGTDVCRHYFGEDCWWRIAANKLNDAEDLMFQGQRLPPRVVFSDMRFENELHGVYNRDGLTIKVIGPQRRAASDAAKQHSSEAGIPDEMFHYVLYNTGTLDDLKTLVVSLLTKPLPDKTTYIGEPA